MTLEFANKTIGLAPMEGVTDFPMRLLFHLIGGMDSIATPFVRLTHSYPPKGVIPPRDLPELLLTKTPYRLIPQVMASDPLEIAKVSHGLLKLSNRLDLNFGCPAPKVVGHGAGSSLLRDPKIFANFLDLVVDSVDPRLLSIKIRTGFNNFDDYPDLLEVINRHMWQAVTIHGRTKEQRYSGSANWKLIHKAARILRSPVIGSGDVTNIQSCRHRFEAHPEISGLIIGRGALRNPFVFQEIRNNQTISQTPDQLLHFLATYALLNRLFHHRFDDLLTLVEDGIFLSPQTNWQAFYSHLAQRTQQPEAIERLECVGHNLGRVKLLWNYMRSSLLHEWQDPKVLRCKSFAELIQQLKGSQKSPTIPLRYQSAWDWIYAGEKKPNLSLSISIPAST